MKDILLKRLFWVVLGAVFVGLIGFYVVIVRGLTDQNSDIRQALHDKLSKMKKYADAKDLKNQKWVLWAQDLKKRVDEAAVQCEEFYAKNIKQINARFLTDPEDPGSGPIKDRAHWKDVYYQERAGLIAELKKAGVEASQGSFDFKEWGERVPTTEDIDGVRTPEGVLEPGAQKEFWLQSHVVDCLVRVGPKGAEERRKGAARKAAKEGGARSHVARVYKFQIQRPSTAEGAPIEGSPDGMAAAAAQYEVVSDPGNTPTYLIIPVTLTVDMDWRYVPHLIRNLETAPWPCYVTRVEAKRLPPAETEKLSASSGISASSLVRLTVYGAALDFTPMKSKIMPSAPAPKKP